MQPLTAVVLLQAMSGSGNNAATDSSACVRASVRVCVCVHARNTKLRLHNLLFLRF